MCKLGRINDIKQTLLVHKKDLKKKKQNAKVIHILHRT